MGDTLRILKVDLLGLRNSFTRGGLKKKLAGIFGTLSFLAFAWLIGFGGFKAASFFRVAFRDYPGLLHLVELNFLTAGSLAVFMLLFMNGVKVIYDNFYESGDLPFLLATPLPVGAVFASKFLKSVGTNLFYLLPFIGALWAGYGVATGAPWGFYLMIMATLVLATVLFTAVASLLVMVIMRFVPSQKMKQFILVGSLLIGLIFVLASQYFSSILADNKGMEPRIFFESVGRWGLEKTGYLPHIWVAKSILLFIPGFAYNAYESILPLGVLAVALLAAAIALARWSFVTGWSASRESAPGTKRSSARQARRGEGAFRGTGGVLWGTLRKDFRVLKRTPMMWYNILVLLVVLGFLAYNMSRDPGNAFKPGRMDFVKTLMLFIIMFVGAAGGTSTSAMSLSLEGKSWWFIKQAPVNPREFYLAKFLYGYLPNLLMSGVAVMAFYLLPAIPMHPVYISVPVLLLATSVLISAGVTLDILSPNFEMVKTLSIGGFQNTVGAGKILISLLASMFLVVFLGAIVAFPSYSDRIGIFSGLSHQASTGLSLAVFVILALALDYLCFWVGRKRLEVLFVGGRE